MESTNLPSENWVGGAPSCCTVLQSRWWEKLFYCSLQTRVFSRCNSVFHCFLPAENGHSGSLLGLKEPDVLISLTAVLVLAGILHSQSFPSSHSLLCSFWMCVVSTKNCSLSVWGVSVLNSYPCIIQMKATIWNSPSEFSGITKDFPSVSPEYSINYLCNFSLLFSFLATELIMQYFKTDPYTCRLLVKTPETDAGMSTVNSWDDSTES